MWTLSGFIDEISDDFSLQCKVAAGLGLRVEVRSAWGTNILDLDESQLNTVREDPHFERSQGFQHWLADRQDLHRR